MEVNIQLIQKKFDELTNFNKFDYLFLKLTIFNG
jgi:hypothetical protein